MTAKLPVRIGHGFDLHRLDALAPAGAGRPFILGGVPFEHDRGPVAHSDGDVLLHAIVDALMGAIGGPDIGGLFPDDDPQYDGADSAGFVAEAMRRVADAGYAIGNLDATVICERPKLGPKRGAVRSEVARLLGVPVEQVNVKATTHERVDAIGAGEAIAVHAVVVLVVG